jgi:CPA2 family monovalent cation:H+ antiporter-2
MDHGGSAGGYKDLVLFLATAGIVVPLFKRLKISPVLGFLAAGVFLGPFGLGGLSGKLPWLDAFSVSRPADIAEMAEFGVVFLLFMIGLELSWERLRQMWRLVFGLGGLQVLIAAAVMAMIAALVGVRGAGLLAIGGALALSSTAIVMPVLAEAQRQHSSAGRASFAALLFQDLAAPVILIVLSILGDAQMAAARAPPVHGHGHIHVAILPLLAPPVIGLLAMAAAGRLALRPIMRSVARAKSPELFVAACLLIAIGAGLISALVGLSMALGGFVAGLLLAETEYRHEVEVTIEPFKGLLLGLFFVSVGISLDLALARAHPFAILGLTLGLIAVKALAAYGAARAMRVDRPPAIETALTLAGAGEFAFVILGGAAEQGLLSPLMGQYLLVAATLSMFATPALSALGGRLGRAISPEPVEQEVPPALADGPPRVLVIGYGRVGQLVGEMLSRHQIAWVAVDNDARAAEAGHRAGHDVFFGDATRDDFLHRFGLARAIAVVVTMDHPEAAEAVVAAARRERPDLTIVTRARDAHHAGRLYALGATDAVPETIEASLQLSEAVLVDIGVPMGLVIASVHERRDEYRAELNRPDALGARGRRARDAARR